jgi:hypothetical protein
LALATVAVGVLAVVIGLQVVRGPAPIGPGPSPSTEPVTASVTVGDYRLTITSPKGTWTTDEAIQVEATLEYLGNAAEETLRGSGSGLIGFGLEELTGDLTMGAAFTTDCAQHPISAEAPIVAPFQKSGGYSADDPDAAFWEAFFADPELHLGAGEWQISAGATFDDGDDCTADPIHLDVAIVLTVEPGTGEPGEPSAQPTEPAEPSVAPSPSEGSEPPFTCDLPITLDAAGSDFHPLITQDIRVGTHDGFDRIVFEYDGGTPTLELDLAQPPFVQDPSGLPMEVNGSVVVRITLTGATKFDTETGEQPYQGPTNFEPGYPQIVQLFEFGDFEAVHNWYLGVNSQTCLRAFTLDDPARLVIDIEH